MLDRKNTGVRKPSTLPIADHVTVVKMITCISCNLSIWFCVQNLIRRFIVLERGEERGIVEWVCTLLTRGGCGPFDMRDAFLNNKSPCWLVIISPFLNSLINVNKQEKSVCKISLVNIPSGQNNLAVANIKTTKEEVLNRRIVSSMKWLAPVKGLQMNKNLVTGACSTERRSLINWRWITD